MKPGKLPIIIFGIILAIILIIAASVVVRAYNRDKGVIPDVSESSSLTTRDISKIQEKYDTEDRKKEFKELAEKIHLAVANKLLDGSVTTDDTLSVEIAKINIMFTTSDWEYIKVDYPKFWVGLWHLDKTGKLSFKFKYKDLEPSWITDETVSQFITQN